MQAATFQPEVPQALTPVEPKIHPELNLEKWSIWKPSKSPSKVLETQVLEREHWLPDGSQLTSKVEVGFTDRGVLTTEDRKTYYALIKIWEDKGRPHGQVSLSLRLLARVLNKKWGTNVIDAMTQSLLRLRLTPFTWENSYFNAQTKEKERLLTAFNILADVKIVRKEKDGHTTKEDGYFKFNDYILRNLLNNHTKPLYLDTLLKFKTEIAQLLYTYLDLIMADKKQYERKSAGLFNDLGLTANAYRKPSVRKQKLEKVLPELQDVPLTTGILTTAKIAPTKSGSDFKVVFRKRKSPQNGENRTEDPSQQPSSQPPLSGSEAETGSMPDSAPAQSVAHNLVTYFHQQLSHPHHQPSRRELRQASTLLEQYGEEQVRYIIDYAITEAKTTNFRMRVFGALLQYQGEAVNAYVEQRTQQEQSTLCGDNNESWHDGTEQQQLAFVLSSEEERRQQEEQQNESTLQQLFDTLDAETKAQLVARAEQKLAAYKARMTKEAYAETLRIAIGQELYDFFRKQGF